MGRRSNGRSAALTGTCWNVIQFPDFQARFDEAAPEECKGYSPPFIGQAMEPGVLQIWTGYCCRTAPGWSSLIRPPANLPRSQNWETYEGIVETDRWFGPLFTNIRLCKTDKVIELRADTPLLQLQPVQRRTYSNEVLENAYCYTDLEAFPAEVWQMFHDTVVARSTAPDTERGAYAAGVRKRREQE